MSQSKLTLACEYLGVTEPQVLSSKEYEDRIVLVLDMGINGCPKHTIPLSELPTPDVMLVDVGFEATDGAVKLADKNGIDLRELYQGERLTVRDVKRAIQERE